MITAKVSHSVLWCRDMSPHNGKLQKWVIKITDESIGQIIFDSKPSSGRFRVAG